MSREQNRVAIIGGVRTPYVRSRNSFGSLGILDLGVIACREVVYRAELLPDIIDETILSQGCSWPHLPNMGHCISLLAGIPQERPSFTVNHPGSSGLQALVVGQERLLARKLRAVLVGGIEASSHYPWLFSQGFFRFLYTFKQTSSFWGRIVQALRFRLVYLRPQDILKKYAHKVYQTGEALAKKFDISREEQDRWAAKSHRMAVQAYEEEKFAEEIVPVHISPDFELCIEKDLHLRENISIETLATSQPFCGEDCTVTEENSSFVCDGASSLLLASEEFVTTSQIEPLGYLRAYGFSGCDSRGEGLAGVLAAREALAKAKFTLKDIDLVEIHESTAAGLLAHKRAFGSSELLETYLGISEPLGEINPDRLNVNGGAIALGHTLGSSGLRLVITLLMELRRQKLKKGLVVLSSCGAQGGALIVERD